MPRKGLVLSEASAAPPQADSPAHAPPWLGTLCPTLRAWLGLVPSGLQVRGNSRQVLVIASAGTSISTSAVNKNKNNHNNNTHNNTQTQTQTTTRTTRTTTTNQPTNQPTNQATNQLRSHFGPSKHRARSRPDGGMVRCEYSQCSGEGSSPGQQHDENECRGYCCWHCKALDTGRPGRQGARKHYKRQLHW